MGKVLLLSSRKELKSYSESDSPDGWRKGRRTYGRKMAPKASAKKLFGTTYRVLLNLICRHSEMYSKHFGSVLLCDSRTASVKSRQITNNRSSRCVHLPLLALVMKSTRVGAKLLIRGDHALLIRASCRRAIQSLRPQYLIHTLIILCKDKSYSTPLILRTETQLLNLSMSNGQTVRVLFRPASR